MNIPYIFHIYIYIYICLKYVPYFSVGRWIESAGVAPRGKETRPATAKSIRSRPRVVGWCPVTLAGVLGSPGLMAVGHRPKIRFLMITFVFLFVSGCFYHEAEAKVARTSPKTFPIYAQQRSIWNRGLGWKDLSQDLPQINQCWKCDMIVTLIVIVLVDFDVFRVCFP